MAITNMSKNSRALIPLARGDAALVAAALPLPMTTTSRYRPN
jgi:hypothetical protein